MVSETLERLHRERDRLLDLIDQVEQQTVGYMDTPDVVAHYERQLDDNAAKIAAYNEMPGAFDDPDAYAFYLSLNMVSCPKCHSPEVRDEEGQGMDIDGICLDCGHRWVLGMRGTNGPS